MAPPEQRVLARRVRTLLYALWSVIGFIALANPASSIKNQNVARLVAALVTIVFVATAVRIQRLGIIVNDEGLRVRNFFRSYPIKRSDIAGFAPPAGYGKMWKAGLIVKRHDGTTVSASAFVRGELDGSQLGTTTTASLEAWLSAGLDGLPPESHLRGLQLVLWRLWLGAVVLLSLILLGTAITAIASPASFAS